MNPEIWLAFAGASAILLAMPGPTVTLVIGLTLASGRRAAWASVPGVALGDFVAMSASLAGAGAILAASATLFTVLKLAGAVYLVWLGVKLWRSSMAITPLTLRATPRPRGVFLQAFTVTALNPKSIVFFVAFVPQFMAADQPLLPQTTVLVATFVTLAAINAALWVAFAGALRTRMTRASVRRWLDRAGGTLLIGAGLVTALARR
ncbi:MAG: LysE family translocator [Alphaproteobacteria bacterium]|nr:LysE family translocator [Alphaproteobacteria bacterium]